MYFLSLTASQQAANVQNKYTDEGGRLISDVLDISDKLKIEGQLVTADIGKAFNSINQNFQVGRFKKNLALVII